VRIYSHSSLAKTRNCRTDCHPGFEAASAEDGVLLPEDRPKTQIYSRAKKEGEIILAQRLALVNQIRMNKS
jgi:hypothetical protein